MVDCKLFIIKDEEDDVKVLADAFVQVGIKNIHCVYSAMQTFSHLKAIESLQDLPLFILMDLDLPGNPCSKFLTSLKKINRYKNIEVNVLSNDKSEKEIERLMKLQSVNYWPKPYSSEGYLEIA